MGHREDLLAGARQCLYELGYGRTTARDIVAASGTNLASIGYHFRSKEALLNAAMIQAIEEWGQEMERVLAGAIDPNAEAAERFEVTWERVIESFSSHQQLWTITFEAFVQAERSPEVRSFLADAIQQGRLGLASLFHGGDIEADEKLASTVGSLYQALLSGVWIQWRIDPTRAPTGRDLVHALRLIQGSMQFGVGEVNKNDG